MSHSEPTFAEDIPALDDRLSQYDLWFGRNFESDGARGADAYTRALTWRGEDPRETDEAAEKLTGLLEAGSDAARGIWTDRPLRARSDFEVDHCIPYAHWHNNSLWNLLPATKAANQSKSDRLPAGELLEASRERMIRWWDEAWIDSPQHRRFIWEAQASLPGTDLGVEDFDLEEISQAVDWQVARMRRDQQIEEWEGP